MEDSYAQEIQKRLEALPPEVQKLIYSADMDTTIQSIGAKHQLHLDQIGALGTEAAAVLLGLTESKDFASEVAGALSVSEDAAAAIVKDINEQLFIKIQNSMKSSPPQATSVPVKTVVAPATLPPKTDLHPTDLMLSQKTVTSAPVPPPPTPPAVPKVIGPTTPIAAAAPTPPAALKPDPAAPQPYKADPYREPLQ